ncbi:G-type lectin S-receptor-like serine/threonine-protein kinase [Tanacetum coccineum]
MQLIWILIGAAISLVLTCLGLFLCRIKLKHKREEKERRKRDEYFLELTASESFKDVHQLKDNGGKGIDLLVFSVASIMAATNDFSVENKLGQGGFGPVYKGKLTDGREVAIKRLSRTSGQGLLEFKNELILIAKLQHTNLVRVHGCCIHGIEKMLIGYMPPEYVMGGTFSVKSDIFSFGVLILEIITGRKNSSFARLDGRFNLLGYFEIIGYR